MPDGRTAKKPAEHRAKPLLDNVLDELGRDIVSGVIAVDETFKLLDISERFGISRTVAREAMRALEQLGLVASSRRVGITVLSPKNWAVFDKAVIEWRLSVPSERDGQLRSLTELRIAVEPIAARSVALHASDAERAQLKDLANEMRQLGESGRGASKRFLDADLKFHALLLTYCRNEMFTALSPSIAAVLEGRTLHGLQPDVPEAIAMESHDRLAEAIMNRDAEGAEHHARALLAEVRDALSTL